MIEYIIEKLFPSKVYTEEVFILPENEILLQIYNDWICSKTDNGLCFYISEWFMKIRQSFIMGKYGLIKYNRLNQIQKSVARLNCELLNDTADNNVAPFLYARLVKNHLKIDGFKSKDDNMRDINNLIRHEGNNPLRHRWVSLALKHQLDPVEIKRHYQPFKRGFVTAKAYQVRREYSLNNPSEYTPDGVWMLSDGSIAQKYISDHHTSWRLAGKKTLEDIRLTTLYKIG